MPYEYDKAKTAVQDPAAKPAPNGQYVMDAVDWNKVNDGVAGLADFVNGLETTVNGKANADDVPDTADFVLNDNLAAAADPESAGGTLVGVYYDGAASTAQESISALEIAVGANTTALTDKANKDEIPSVEGLQTAEQVQTAIGAAVEPLAAQASVDALSTEVEGKADAADIPDVSGFQTAAQVQTAITTAVEPLATQASVDALGVEVESKADAAEIPDVSGFQTEAQVSAAITAATADLAAQASVDALETAVAGKADTSELAGYVQTSFLESRYTTTANYENGGDPVNGGVLSGANRIGVYYVENPTTIQTAIDDLVERVTALESALEGA